MRLGIQGEGKMAIDLRHDEGLHEVVTAYVESKLPRQLRRFLGVSDVVQSVFCAAQSARGQFRGVTPAEYRGWLIRIARNKIIDALRRHQKRSMPPEVHHQLTAFTVDEPILRTPETHVSLTEQAHRLMEAMGSLPDEIRRVMLLRYTQQLAFDRIGLELGMCETTVRRRWFEGLEILGDQLKDVCG